MIFESHNLKRIMTSLKLSNYSLFSDIDMGRMNYISFVVVQLLIEGWLCHSMDYSTPGFPVHQPSPGVCSNSCPLNQWCHPTISSSIIPFSSCLQSFPASGSFQSVWHQVVKASELQLQHQSFQRIFRVDFL